MADKEKNPAVLVEAISILPILIKTLASVFKSKKKDKPEDPKDKPTTVGESVVESIKDAVSGEISSTRVLNVGGTLVIIYIAWEDIAVNGITSKNIALVVVGALYSVAMGFVSYLKERDSKA